MIQYQVDLQELAEILKDHFGVEGSAQVDVALTYKAGRVGEGERPALPTILTQITGIVLTVDVPPETQSRPRRRARRQTRAPVESQRVST